MIEIKSKREIELIKEACKIVAIVYEEIEKVSKLKDDRYTLSTNKHTHF